MRAPIFAITMLAACGGNGGDGNGTCTSDNQCGGDVCARDGECLPASAVRMLKVTWTISGQQASATTCGTTPSFELLFSSATSYFGYAPVPCMEGLFTIDKIPTSYSTVELDVDGTGRYLGAAPISSASTVSFDVQL